MSKAAELAALIGSQSALSNRNLIINGACVIDQRNGGSSVTPADTNYTIDRWRYTASQASKFTFQQNAGSVTPPAGFENYMGFTVASAVTVGSSDYFAITQRIEGYNVNQLEFGTANAKTVTLSFWVRSSLTGTFGGSLRGASFGRSYPFTYSISSANAWEYKTVTVAGDTSGTYQSGNTTGLEVIFGLGAGSTYSGSAGAWTASGHFSATGAVSVVGTGSATWYVTGVQLEVGEQATPFEHRSYNDELLACMRYYQQVGGELSNVLCTGQCTSTTLAQFWIPFIVPVRDDPTCSVSDQTHFRVFNAAVSGIPDTTNMTIAATNAASHGGFRIQATVGSGLVAGNATMLSGSDSDSNAGIIKMDAEL